MAFDKCSSAPRLWQLSRCTDGGGAGCVTTSAKAKSGFRSRSNVDISVYVHRSVHDPISGVIGVPINPINGILWHLHTYGGKKVHHVMTANANMAPCLCHQNKSGISKMMQDRKHHWIAGLKDWVLTSLARMSSDYFLFFCNNWTIFNLLKKEC